MKICLTTWRSHITECLREWVEELAAGRGHAVAAEPAQADRRVERLQFADQVGAVQVATRLAGADEDVHRTPSSRFQVPSFVSELGTWNLELALRRRVALDAGKVARGLDLAVAEGDEHFEDLAPGRERAAVFPLVAFHRAHERGFVVVVVALAGGRVDEPTPFAGPTLLGRVLPAAVDGDRDVPFPTVGRRRRERTGSGGVVFWVIAGWLSVSTLGRTLCPGRRFAVRSEQPNDRHVRHKTTCAIVRF